MGDLSNRELSKWLSLCDLVLSDEADDAQLDEFNRRMPSSPELAEHYLNYADLCVDLDRHASNAPAQEIARVLVSNEAGSDANQPKKRGLPLFLLAVAASLLALVALSWPRSWPQGESNEIAKADLSSVSVALITKVEDVKWKDGRPLEAGTLLVSNQWIEIDDGHVEVEFTEGAVAVINGPARFAPVSSNSALLELGSLAAIVPPWAEGFRVDMPELLVVDRGTQFAVSVDASRDVDVAVTKGEVEIAQGNSRDTASDTRLLTAGAGVRATRNGVASTQMDTTLVGLTQRLPVRPDGSEVEHIAGYWKDFAPGVPDEPTSAPGWRYCTNATGPIGNPQHYQDLLWDPAAVGWYDVNGSDRATPPSPLSVVKLRPKGGHPGKGSLQSADGIDRYAIAAFTVPRDGVYRLESGWIVRPEHRAELKKQGVDVLVHIDDQPPVIAFDCRADRFRQFSGSLGRLKAGATIYVCVGPEGINYNDRFEWGFVIAREIKQESSI